MVNEDIVKYISSNLKRGLNYDEIHAQLLAQNYSDYDIKEAKDYLFSEKKLPPNYEMLSPFSPAKIIKYFVIFLLIIFIIFIIILIGKFF